MVPGARLWVDLAFFTGYFEKGLRNNFLEIVKMLPKIISL
jgi:hypothetical protein